MPGKHVRFDIVDDTPSPSYSTSSLPSSTGPITPSYPTIPLPPLNVPVHIHPLLAYHPHHPSLIHDLSLRSSTALSNRGTPLPPALLAQPATSPPLPHLTLLHPALPWPVPVPASSPKLGVSTADLLDALYRALRLAASAAEFSALPQDPQRAISTAFHARVVKVPGGRRAVDEERAKGLKRIDFLAGGNRWLGLSSTKRGPDVWMLNSAPS